MYGWKRISAKIPVRLVVTRVFFSFFYFLWKSILFLRLFIFFISGGGGNGGGECISVIELVVVLLFGSTIIILCSASMSFLMSIFDMNIWMCVHVCARSGELVCLALIIIVVIIISIVVVVDDVIIQSSCAYSWRGAFVYGDVLHFKSPWIIEWFK